MFSGTKFEVVYCSTQRKLIQRRRFDYLGKSGRVEDSVVVCPLPGPLGWKEEL